MKLIIKEHGDSSVGIPESYYEIECPFELDENCQSGMERFKDQILDAYKEYAEMKMEAFYDFENQFVDDPPMEYFENNNNARPDINDLKAEYDAEDYGCR